MIVATIRRALMVIVLGSAMVFVAGCGKSVSGVYAADGGALTVDFQADGKATITTMLGSAMDATYTVDGKNVTVKMNGESKVFTINDDGSLAGPGITLKKK
jgi:hypothetical protein